MATDRYGQGQRKAKNLDPLSAPVPAMPIPSETKWYNRHTPIGPGARGEAEEDFLALSPEYKTTVLNLAGLWGGSRNPRNWVGRVAPTKDALSLKVRLSRFRYTFSEHPIQGSLHMIHGLDVARAILAVHRDFEMAQGQRWLLTDGRVYDWWDLASAWGLPSDDGGTSLTPQEDGPTGPHARWVQELMQEHGVRALPRDVEKLGRALDSREFWSTFSLSPLKARLS